MRPPSRPTSRRPGRSPWSVAGSAAAGAASATSRPDARRRSATISARIDRATSAGVRAPMSSPHGVRTRARRSSSTSSDATTASPRLRLATRPTYATPAPSSGRERRLLVPSVRGDDDGRRPRQGLGAGAGAPRLDREAEPVREPGQGLGDRGRPVDQQQRCGQLGLEEDLQGPAGQARVVHGQHPVLVRLRLGGDAQQQRLAGVQQRQALRAHRRLGAGPADEALDGAVAEHEGLVTGLGRRGPLGADHAGQDERHPLGAQRRRPRLDGRSAHVIARSVRNGRPCIVRQTWAGVSGMSACTTP